MKSAGLAFLVLDDHELVLEAIGQRLRADFPGCTITYSGGSLKDAVNSTRTMHCDCAIVDLDLGDGATVAQLVTSFTLRGIPVVVVSALGRPEVIKAALAVEVSAFVTKRSSAKFLTTAIKEVLRGGTWFPADMAGVLLQGSGSVDLSAQERRALTLYASGLTLDMVARRMDVSPNTAKHYIDRVRAKYTAAGIASRTKMELNTVARNEGMLP
ncbi:MAG: response regulator [Actinobacteria bacterium]|jgi:DNA-binding NarL/FixJ family response regulator|uniref:Unannotated protein n=1 Tax=freshwater metagenome TaxID=449393 RepID=A0A6J7IL55_9ZZZZ|nr:response regulator [Actinomycetota bacterium]